ncbi:YegS/Rv2252/BmrU family lipid kinase, partial [Roseibium algae]
SACLNTAMICASLYRPFFIKNLLRYLAEKILLLNTTNFRGDYRGDGTLNEVVAASCEAVSGNEKLPFAFGLLPLGSANDFAHGIGLNPTDISESLWIAATGETKTTDLGQVNGRVFVNVATGGFGTRVTTETDPKLKNLLGGAAYLFTGLHRFSELAACSGRVEAEGFSWEGDFVALAIGNGRQAGGGVQLCPDAVLDDGLLDVTIIPYPKPGEMSDLLKHLVEFGLEGLRDRVIMAQLAELVLETEKPLQINLDGEPIHETRLEFSTLSGGIYFRRP